MFWITTVRLDGRPHVTSLVAVWLDDAIHSSTGETEQKAVNLSRVLLATGCNTWGEGLDVVVEGDVVPVADNARLIRLARACSAKWDGRWQYQVQDGRFRHPHGGVAMVYSVTPAKVLAFGKEHFTHTSHRFSMRCSRARPRAPRRRSTSRGGRTGETDQEKSGTAPRSDPYPDAV